jgi:F-type H+-transporting ATPase subunit b
MPNETELHATVEEGTSTDAGVLASLGLNAQLFVFQLINFAIVALIVWYLILKPLTKKIEERKKIIDESLENAQKVQTRLQMAELKYQEKIDEAKAEANRVIEMAYEEGKRLSVEIKNKAGIEITALTNQARKNIQIEKETMVAELKKDTTNLVVAAVEKILNEKIDEKKDMKLIEESLK